MGLAEYLSSLIGNNLIATLVISFFPLIELKGGIIFARNYFGFLKAFGLSYLGSTIAFFPVFFLLIPILKLLKKIKFINSFACSIENYIKSKADEALVKSDGKIRIKSEKGIKQLAVFIFVAIPLPMTGIWMGTAIAVFLGMKFKEAVLPVISGNFVAGLIISLLAQICIWIFPFEKVGFVLDCILYGLLVLALILLVITVVKIVRGKRTKE